MTGISNPPILRQPIGGFDSRQGSSARVAYLASTNSNKGFSNKEILLPASLRIPRIFLVGLLQHYKSN